MRKRPHSMRKLRRVGDGIVATRICISEIEVKEVVTQRFEMFSQPQHICEGLTLCDLHVESGPAPPSEQVAFRDPAVVQFADRSSIVLELGMIVGSSCKHQAF